MTGRMKLAAGFGALVFVVSLLTAAGSTADRLAGAAKAGARCRLTAAAPTEANDKITGNGSIRCKTSRTVHMHIETQILQQRQWLSFGSLDVEGLRVRAGRTRHVSTGAANCKGLGQLQMRTILRLGRADGRGPRTTSPIVKIACSEHRHP